MEYDAGSDTLTISDSTLSFGGKIEDLPAKETDVTGNDGETKVEPSKLRDLTYSMSLSAGAITITGLKHDNGKFTAASWSYSDDTEFDVAGAVEGDGRLKMEGRLTGTLATNYSFTMPEIPPEDPEHPVSRWLPFATTSLLMSFAEIKVDSTGATMEAYAEADGQETLVLSGTLQMDGYRMANAVDGLIGEYTIDSVSQTLRTLDVKSGQMLGQTTRQGKTVYTDVNAAAILNLFDPDVAETGEEVTLVGSGSTIDYETTQDIAEGLSVAMAVEKASIADITVIKRDNNFLEMFDKLLNQTVPAPEELITNVFQFYRSFGVGDARDQRNFCRYSHPPTPDGNIGLTIKEMALTGLSSNGIGEMLIVGLDAPELPQGGSVKLDWAAIGDIEFAEYSPMREMISTVTADPTYAENHSLEIARAFMPRSFAYEIEGLDVNVPEVGRTRIGKTELAVSTTVPPIPTSLYTRSDGIEVPVSSVEDAEIKALLDALGLETVVWSDETRLYWDEATLELRLDRLMVKNRGAWHGRGLRSLRQHPEGSVRRSRGPGSDGGDRRPVRRSISHLQGQRPDIQGPRPRGRATGHSGKTCSAKPWSPRPPKRRHRSATRPSRRW
ncbi:hypothetical protein QW131_27195 [Roseibium salinum]|nr:hypothetical protein [Roseibium salinum]